MAENIPSRTRRESVRTPSPVRALPAPPDHLTPRCRHIWQAIVADWVIGPEALPILRAALEQLDVYDLALAQLVRDGLTVVHPDSGTVRAHPAAKIAQDALSSFRQCFRQLGLEPPEAA
jgi:P27 family predicted phage terminase small subunit